MVKLLSTSSSSFLSLLPLSYCEHQQTTYYSSSGFAILRSSPRFLFTNIVNPQQTSSFHHHNAVLFAVDQSLSPTIATLMSSNENNRPVDSDYNNSTTPLTTTSIYSLLSTTTFSNVTGFHTTQRETNRTLNIALLGGCISASVILIIIIIYAFIKYRNRDEGSYKIDESKNFVTNPHIDNHDNGGCGGKISSSNHHRQKLLATNESNVVVDSREWYV
ncbi:unnamed protein product [Adineta steineri]|uniref:Neurexin/syndecan/glycophorin C domain-containing protein n=1 Tax=Adineta steineri TaxID=433720 RepID=A0A819ENW6_9BILA|nr:unnamed protein product [Adineta steineri]CAF3852191.1 unnamed protein product [Adineta steineri]